MAEAGLWAAVGQSALIVGALLVARVQALTQPRWLGLIMAFGAGTLISAVTTELLVPAYNEAGRGWTGLGLFLGAGGYYALTRWLDVRAERETPEEVVEDAEAVGGPEAEPIAVDEVTARNLSVGMALDGLPASIAIGLTLLATGDVPIALVGAVFLSSLPEAVGVAAGLLGGGQSLAQVLGRFATIVALGAIAGAAGYGVLDATELDAIALIQSIAGGAMIIVTVNEMVPLAVEGAGRRAGLGAAGGFAVAAWLSTLS